VPPQPWLRRRCRRPGILPGPTMSSPGEFPLSPLSLCSLCWWPG
jgi:hypothetical protein